VLDAFLAGHELRKGASVWDEYYLGNLPADCRPGTSKGHVGVEKATPEIVRRTVQETRRRMGEPATRFAPLLVGRNVYVLLEEEKLSGADTLNRALRPYWPRLWRLAARGHYYTTQQPIRESPRISEHVFKAPIPPMSEGGFTLSFARVTATIFPFF
jgi:hypothetical protein